MVAFVGPVVRRMVAKQGAIAKQGCEARGDHEARSDREAMVDGEAARIVCSCNRSKDGCEARCGKDRSFVRSFVGSFVCQIVRRMVAKQGAARIVRSTVRSFEGWLQRMVAKDGCEARCGNDRSFVCSSDSSKDGCKGWLRSKVRQGSFVRSSDRSSDRSFVR